MSLIQAKIKRQMLLDGSRVKVCKVLRVVDRRGQHRSVLRVVEISRRLSGQLWLVVGSRAGRLGCAKRPIRFGRIGWMIELITGRVRATVGLLVAIRTRAPKNDPRVALLGS